MGEGVFIHCPLTFILILSASKDEDVPRPIRWCVKVWVPAFAGNMG